MSSLSARDCDTLHEYFEEVLHMTQAQVAKACETSQPWISQIANGHLPRGFNQDARQKLLNGMQLRGQEQEFVRMVRRGGDLKDLADERKRLEKAMKTPADQDFPLGKYAKAERRAPVAAFSYSSNLNAPAGTIVRLG